MIVDDVMLGREDEEYRRLLFRHEVGVVGLFASPGVLKERERRRGDCEPGLARWQFKRLHRDKVYDLEIDTTAKTPEAVAGAIAATFKLVRLDVAKHGFAAVDVRSWSG